MMKAVAIGDWRLGWARNTSTWQAYDRSENLSVRLLGSRARSPAPGPRRTERASFPALSSSLSKASFDTRSYNFFFGLLPPMAIEMVHLKVACRVSPTIWPLHNVAKCPRR